MASKNRPRLVSLKKGKELDHVLEKTYYSRQRVNNFLESLCRNKELTGPDPQEFWRTVKFLQIQQRGDSQSQLLDMFDGVLETKWGFKGQRSRSAEYSSTLTTLCSLGTPLV